MLIIDAMYGQMDYKIMDNYERDKYKQVIKSLEMVLDKFK